MAAISKPVKVPIEYAGQWIAWDFAETRIVASGRSYQDARQGAELAGERRPVLEKVPDTNVRFIGGLR